MQHFLVLSDTYLNWNHVIFVRTVPMIRQCGIPLQLSGQVSADVFVGNGDRTFGCNFVFEVVRLLMGP